MSDVLIVATILVFFALAIGLVRATGRMIGLAMPGRPVEAASGRSVPLLDKTGIIANLDRVAIAFVPVRGIDEETLAEAALLASAAEETPESRSIIDFGESRFPIVLPDLAAEGTVVAFTTRTRMSGVDIHGRQVRKGAARAVCDWVRANGGQIPADLDGIAAAIAEDGGTALVIAEGSADCHAILGVVRLKAPLAWRLRSRYGPPRRRSTTT